MGLLRTNSGKFLPISVLVVKSSMIKSNQCHSCPEKFKNYHLLYKPISSLKFQIRENRLLLSPSITDYLR